MTKTKAPTASSLVARQLDDIRAGELAAGRVTAAQAQGDAEINDAVAKWRESLDEQVLGRAGADERVRGNAERVSQARAQRAALDEQAASAYRVVQAAKSALRQIRLEHLSELSAEVEEAIAEVTEAAVALSEPTRRYVAAYERARQMCEPLIPALRSRVASDDAEKGIFRSGESFEKDLRVPVCPLTDNLLRAIATTVPRPAAMAADYDPNPFRSEPAMEGDVMPALTGPDGKLMFDGTN